MRPPRDAPCLADPEDFDCGDCSIGWLAFCRLRTDETFRHYEAAVRRTDGGAVLAELPDAVRVMASAVALAKRQRMAITAPLVAGQMAADKPTPEHVEFLLRNSPTFRETSPGYFALSSESEAEDSEVPVVTAGSAVAMAAADLRPPPFEHQLRLLCRRAGLVALHAEGELALEAAIHDLQSMVLRREAWSLGKALDVALGRVLAAPTDDAAYRDVRSRYLAAVCGTTLAREPSEPGLDEVKRISADIAASNYRLVVAAARGFQPTHWVRFAELVQEGFIGLMRAIDAYDPYRGFRLTTYATWWIRQSMSRAADDLDRLVRLPVHVLEKLRRLERSDHAGPLTPVRIAEELGVDEATAVRILGASVTPIPLELVAAHHASSDAVGLIEEVEASLLKQSVQRALGTLTPRERRVIVERYGLDDGVQRTLEAVGKGLGVTRERIRQIEGKAFKKLKHPSRSRHLAPWHTYARRGLAGAEGAGVDAKSAGRGDRQHPSHSASRPRGEAPSPTSAQPPSRVPNDLVATITHRAGMDVRALGADLAQLALGKPMVIVRQEKTTSQPSYFTIRRRPSHQVVAYVTPRSHDLLVDFRLPSDHPARRRAKPRTASRYFGIQLSVRSPRDLAEASDLLDEALRR